MKTKIIGLFAAAGLVAIYAAACNVEQPPAACPLPHTSVFVKYTPQDPAQMGACAELTGEYWSLAKFNTPGETTNTIAVRPEQAANFFGDPRLDDADTLNAVGDFEFEATDGFCSASNIKPLAIDVPEVSEALEDGGTDVTPAAKFTYDIQELRLVGTTQVPGTQFDGKMAYTEGGCTATYDLTGISPAVDCCQLDPETEECVEGADGQPVPDDTRCNATTDEDGTVHPACNAFHECLNPDFKLKCDPVTLFCMPAGELPSVNE